jgi:glycosyltransferase involved in cell wall biosynthesis
MISVCMITKNAGATLAASLNSVRSFVEVVILDNGSTDQTEQIAKSFPNVKYYESTFIGFGPLRNLAASYASNDWILALDSDEVLSEALIKEIKSLKLDTTAYLIPRHNYYNGKRINGCGWGGEKVARLYNKNKIKYSDSQVHESLLPCPLSPLKSPILHTPYRSTADFLSKMQHYSSLFAKENQTKKRSSFIKAIGKAAWTFFRSYILKKGMFLGKEGLIISLYNANTTFYKYLKLLEMQSYDCASESHSWSKSQPNRRDAWRCIKNKDQSASR